MYCLTNSSAGPFFKHKYKFVTQFEDNHSKTYSITGTLTNGKRHYNIYNIYYTFGLSQDKGINSFETVSGM